MYFLRWNKWLLYLFCNARLTTRYSNFNTRSPKCTSFYYSARPEARLGGTRPDPVLEKVLSDPTLLATQNVHLILLRNKTENAFQCMTASKPNSNSFNWAKRRRDYSCRTWCWSVADTFKHVWNWKTVKLIRLCINNSCWCTIVQHPNNEMHIY